MGENIYEESYCKHYISVRSDGGIIGTWSDGPHPEKDVTGAICINERGGYQFCFPDYKEENPIIFEPYHMIPLYRWNGGRVVKRTEAEIESERRLRPSPSPSKLDQLRADVDFLLAIGGVL